ncbi:heme-dependent oxidative N-demethylase family protein [Rudanella paleaurantiibacter]|nr:DUF3445 domain-containing protein [Rudanella paleaurantiibacter]
MLPYFPFGDRFNDKMGTAPLGPTEPLLEVDTQYRAEIALKRQLLVAVPGYYAQALPGSELAQWEAAELIMQQMARYYPDSFSFSQQAGQWLWSNRILGEATAIRSHEEGSLPTFPIDWIGQQVQEDLLLLSGQDVRLVAGQLCFGNGWCLDEKLGLPFWEIHAPINPIVTPMMQAAGQLMQRLPAGRTVWRLNWSIKASNQLDMSSRRMPDLNGQLQQLLPALTPETVGDQLFIRIERQTLTRLPRSGSILFGIHTYQNRLADELSERPDAARRLLNVLNTTPPAMLDYKGISPFLEPLIRFLERDGRPKIPMG